MRTVRLLSLAVVTAVSVIGCQSGAENPLTVTEEAPSPLAVTPSLATLDGGQAVQLSASLTLPNGSQFTPDNVNWSSGDDAIAAVGPDGTVRGLRAGRVQIIATWQDRRGSSLIVVTDQVAKKRPACPVHLKQGAESSLPVDKRCTPA
jgi:Big-like domain-containing protein